ncbi:hypothetical protein Tco_0044206, partial [Tanacetum coccineum]
QVEWRLGSWVEVVQPLQVKYDQLCEPDTQDKDKSCFLLPQSMLCQIPFVFCESVDGLITPQRICSTKALGLSNPEVFPVRHRLIMVVSALHGWNMSLVVTLDKCMTSFGYPNLLTNSTRVSGVGGGEKARLLSTGVI